MLLPLRFLRILIIVGVICTETNVSSALNPFKNPRRNKTRAIVLLFSELSEQPWINNFAYANESKFVYTVRIN